MSTHCGQCVAGEDDDAGTPGVGTPPAGGTVVAAGLAPELAEPLVLAQGWVKPTGFPSPAAEVDVP